jgi:hypothetical protein
MVALSVAADHHGGGTLQVRALVFRIGVGSRMFTGCGAEIEQGSRLPIRVPALTGPEALAGRAA